MQHVSQQSLQQHRIAQAIERLSAIWMQSGKSYKDMMSNLFGAKVRVDTQQNLFILVLTLIRYSLMKLLLMLRPQTQVGEMTGYGHGTNSQDIL